MIPPKMKAGFKFVCSFQVVVLLTFFVLPANLSFAQTVSVLNLPQPGTMVTASEKFVPPLVRGITLHPENPLAFDFIIDPGNAKLNRDELKLESEKLVKYFLASLTIPEEDLWVNLSPYEKSRIVPEKLGETEMGRDLLAQDYVLKQLSASLIYPEKDLGKDFWNRVYQKAKAAYGTTDIPVNTFNKVWIVPEKATILETDNTAFIVKSRLKVMLEQDYIALDENRANEVLGTDALQTQDVEQVSAISSAIVKEIILPEIEREVNEGKNFAPLRQIYNSLLLAIWFKNNLKDNVINQVYSNQDKVSGVDVDDKTIKEQIYQQYLAAYRKGVFNYIKEDSDVTTGEAIPRKYFSGGFAGQETADAIRRQRLDATSASGRTVASFIASGDVSERELSTVDPAASFERVTTVLGSRQDVNRAGRRDVAMLADLRNGSRESMPVVTTTFLGLEGLMERGLAGGLALGELHKKAVDPAYQIESAYVQPLQEFSLLDSRGNLLDAVRNIVLSSIEGQGSEIRLVNPVAERAAPTAEEQRVAQSINFLYTGDAFLNEVVPVVSLIQFAHGRSTVIPNAFKPVLIEHGLLDASGNLSETVRNVARQFDAAMLSDNESFNQGLAQTDIGLLKRGLDEISQSDNTALIGTLNRAAADLKKSGNEFGRAAIPEIARAILKLQQKAFTQNLAPKLTAIRDEYNALGDARQLDAGALIDIYSRDIPSSGTIRDIFSRLPLPAEYLSNISVSELDDFGRELLRQSSDLAEYAFKKLAVNKAKSQAKDFDHFTFFAFAANPPTRAHDIIQMFEAQASSGADRTVVNPTGDDYRKPSLKLTASARAGLVETIAELFQVPGVRPLVDVFESDQATYPDTYNLNGEERFAEYVRRNFVDRGVKFRGDYVIGEDHAKVFYTGQNGAVAFEPVRRGSNDKDYNFYVGLESYGDLFEVFRNDSTLFPVQDAKELDDFLFKTDGATRTTRTSQERRDLLRSKLEAGEVVRLPKLDTFAKIWLINRDLQKRTNFSTDSSIRVIVTKRGESSEEFVDPNLTKLNTTAIEGRVTTIAEPIFNEGSNQDISATIIRNSLTTFLNTGKASRNQLITLSNRNLQALLDPSKRGYLYVVLKPDVPGKTSEYPKAVEVLLPSQSRKAFEDEFLKPKQNSLMRAIRQEGGALADLQVSDTVDLQGKVSVLSIQSPSSGLSAVVKYKVRYGFDPVKEQAKISNVVITDKQYSQGAERFESAIRLYLTALNSTDADQLAVAQVVDNAMLSNGEFFGKWQDEFAKAAQNLQLNEKQNPISWAPVSPSFFTGTAVGNRYPAWRGVRNQAVVRKVEDAMPVLGATLDETGKLKDLERKTNLLADFFINGQNDARIVIQKEGDYDTWRLISSRVDREGARSYLSATEMQDYLNINYSEAFSAGVAGNDQQFLADRLRELNETGILPAALQGLELRQFMQALAEPNESQKEAVRAMFGVREALQKKIEDMAQQRTSLDSGAANTVSGFKRDMHALSSLMGFMQGLATSRDKKAAPVDSAILSDETEGVTIFDDNLGETGDAIRAAASEQLSRSRESVRRSVPRELDALRNDTSFVATDENVGGIDLNPANLKIEINKENGGVNVQYDPILIQQLRDQGIDGFVPFIINMQPMPSILPLLGEAAPQERPMQLTSL